MTQWTAANIPPQHGKLAYVTGANSGIGFHTTLELARQGATVIMACRDLAKAESARQRILQQVPSAELEIAQLDLASLASVHSGTQAFLATNRRLDLLINNAGIM